VWLFFSILSPHIYIKIMSKNIIVLSGGTGTPKLLLGLKELIPNDCLTVIVNTAEDIIVSGNKICPDLDTVSYLFSGHIDTGKWWGVKNDTFNTHNALLALGINEGMLIGDTDRATHITRTGFLDAGMNLTQATASLCNHLGIDSGVRILPMCNEDVATQIITPEEKLHFQDFWVGRKGKDTVLDVEISNIENAHITAEIYAAFDACDIVIIGPSNPITSIGPIIAIPGMIDLLKGKKVIAVSPIIGKEPVSGPAGKLMAAMDMEVSSKGVAACYQDFVDVFVIDSNDLKADYSDIGNGIKVVCTDTMMTDMNKSIQLATFILGLCEEMQMMV